MMNRWDFQDTRGKRNCLVPRFSTLLVRLWKLATLPLSFFRLLALEASVVIPDSLSIFRKNLPKKKLRIFNLDLHIAVIPEFVSGLAEHHVNVTQFSLSNHNHLVRRWFPSPDPVAIVNQRTWQDLSSDRVGRFQRRYGTFLRAFDGFVLTHTPAFFQLLSKFEKPTLIVSATRYETPFTHAPAE